LSEAATTFRLEPAGEDSRRGEENDFFVRKRAKKRKEPFSARNIFSISERSGKGGAGWWYGGSEPDHGGSADAQAVLRRTVDFEEDEKWRGGEGE